MCRKDQRSGRAICAQPVSQLIGLAVAPSEVLKERVERGQFINFTKLEEAGRFQAPTPLARIDLGRLYAVLAKAIADAHGLITTGLGEIALGCAVAEFELARIAGSRCKRVSHDRERCAIAESAPEFFLGG